MCVGAFLVLLGLVPLVAAVFQAVPGVVVYGATLLMFALVGVSGYRVVEMSSPGRRDYLVVTLAIVAGYLVSGFVDRIPGLSGELVMILQFPVSTGAMLAIVFEFAIPGRRRV